MSPAVVVTANVPLTVVVPKSKAILFTTLALPVVPAVNNDTAPVAANVPKSISASACVVLKIDVPPTVTVPLSVIFPVVEFTLRLFPTLDVPSSVAMVLIMLALPVAPLVFKFTAPVNANVLKSIVAFAADVVKFEVPDTVTTPLSVILPVVAVATKSPPTPEVSKSNAVAFTTVALPVVPFVLNVTEPVEASVPRSISASACVVVKLEVLVTVNVLLSVTLPVVAIAANVPVTVPSMFKAVSFVMAVLPAEVKTTSASACNVSNVMPACPISFSVTLPTTLTLPLSVIAPFVVFTSKVPEIVLAAISIAVASDKTTLLPLTIVTAPLKSFVAVFKVMLSPT